MTNKSLKEVIIDFNKIIKKCDSSEAMATLSLLHIANMLSEIAARMPEKKLDK